MDISDEQIAQFETDGFLIVERIITDTQADRILAAMSRVYNGTYNRDVRPAALRQQVTPIGSESTLRVILNARTVDADVWDLVTDTALGHAAARLLRTSSVSIIEDQLINKPDHGSPLNIHQDYSYWTFSTSANTLSCWIALSDITPAMGPVELVRGSHRWGFDDRPRHMIHSGNSEYLTAAQAVIPKDAEFQFVSAIVPKGGGAFFHGLTFHGSRGNATDQCRRAASLHWAASDCRLDRSKLVDYDHPYLFTGLRQGDQLVNKYLPQVYSD